MRLHVNMRLHVRMRLHVHMHLHVRLDLSSSCNQRTRSGCHARFVGYERLEDMNDCRFLHYWKLSISPGRYMYRNGGCERTVHSLQFLPGKSFTASNRSYPAKMSRRPRPGPGAGPRRTRAAPGPGTGSAPQTRTTKKGRTGVSNPVRPRRARFLAVATLGKTSRLDRAGPLQPTRPLGPMRCCNRGLNPCGQRNRRADQLPAPLWPDLPDRAQPRSRSDGHRDRRSCHGRRDHRNRHDHRGRHGHQSRHGHHGRHGHDRRSRDEGRDR